MLYDLANDMVHAYPWEAIGLMGYTFLLYAATAIWRL
ncbi:hypothetical protein EVC13_025 [Rhizobium phage RHph_I65]|nr:hypothetical protein EVC13_025 [Rhizobium phage RHph_I65]